MCLQWVDCTQASNIYSSTLSITLWACYFAVFSLPCSLVLYYESELLLTPETNVFPVSEGARSRHRTSAPWPWKLCRSCPLSTSHRAQVPSPLAVRIYRMWEEESQHKNQQMTFRSQRNNWHPTPNYSFNLMKYYAIHQSHKPSVNLSAVHVFYF